MGLFDRWKPTKNPSGLLTFGSRATIRLRQGSGPTTRGATGEGLDHPVLRRYAQALGLDLSQNMLVAEESWVVVTGRRLVVYPPGPVAGTSAQPAFRLERGGASVAWLEHKMANGDDVAMLHLSLANGRFVLADVYRSDDGDVDGFIEAFAPSAAQVGGALARTALGTAPSGDTGADR